MNSSNKLTVTENNHIFEDKMEPGAFIGALMIASGIANSAIIYHGYSGCNIESIHMRSDTIINGTYTPIIATGLNEGDSIYGGFDKLKRTLEEVACKKYDFIWIITGDATSITADDIYGVVDSVNISANTKVIAVDVPGFLGGIAKGTDVALCKLLQQADKKQEDSKGLNLVAPHLMGIKSHPHDIIEIRRLLEETGIPVNAVLSKNLDCDDIQNLNRSNHFIPLTWEDMPDFKAYIKQNNLKYFDKLLALPLGIANTEKWLFSMAELFQKTEIAKEVLIREKEIVNKQLKYNYNFSWLSTLYTEKSCAIYGNSQFAASLAGCLYYDFNIRPELVAIIAETDEAIKKSKKYLAEIAEYTDIELLFNPDYYTYVKRAKAHNVDFAIGSIQDKPLCTGEGIPHLCLAGYYFFNNYNFIPWPYMGIRGILSIATELGFLMDKAFYYEKYWKNYSYKPGEDNKDGL